MKITGKLLAFLAMLVSLLLMLIAFSLGLQARPGSATSEQTGAASTKVDLNNASEKDLESLPGVGAATAKKIIAGRPYSSTDDLSKAGVSAATIKKITPLVSVGAASSAPVSTARTKPAAVAKPAASSATGSSASGGLVDLNSASAAELKDLPGVGDATAKKIIAGRPFSSVNDLSKAGVSASTIGKISSLVTVGGAAAAIAPPAPATQSASRPPSSASTPPPTSLTATSAAPSTAPAKASPSTQGTPGNGMVWVNTDSGTYHKEGSRYYGKTKNGKYMTEADAVKAGFHAAKNGQ